MSVSVSKPCTVSLRSVFACVAIATSGAVDEDAFERSFSQAPVIAVRVIIMNSVQLDITTCRVPMGR